LAITHGENMLHDGGGGGLQFRWRGAHSNEGGTGDVGTTHKLEFPKFDGKGDPLPWLNCYERSFCLRRTPDNQKVTYTTFNLLNNA
jgi:hypothetical protein